MTKPVFKIMSVNKIRAPRYPGAHESIDLAPAVRYWFSPATLALAGLSGLCLPWLRGANAADDEKSPSPTDKQVQQVMDEYLKDYAKPDEKTIEIKLNAHPNAIPANPELRRATELTKGPREIQHEPAQSKGRVAFHIERPPLDFDKARKAARELFKLYGVELKANTRVAAGSATFEADGYNEAAKIGFELVVMTQEHLRGSVADSDAELVPTEYAVLSQQIEKNKTNVLVIQDTDLGDSSLSEYAAMKAFLQSVVDYLEWLRASGKL